MDLTRETYGVMKDSGCTLNFQEVRAEVNRVCREGDESELRQKVADKDADGVYFILFGRC
jgi:hypothetical protein